MLIRQKHVEGIREGRIRVRKLKAVGLTEGLEIGYRLSARGTSILRGSTAATIASS